MKSLVPAVALLCAISIHAQAPKMNLTNPFLGAWKLNLEKSNLVSRAPSDFVSFRYYEDHGNGWIYHAVISSSGKGAGLLITAARYDEKEYPVYTSPQLGAFLTTGEKTPRAVAFKRVDRQNLEFTDRVNGAISTKGICTVSEDGKTLTIKSQNFDRNGKEVGNNTDVYDKQ